MKNYCKPHIICVAEYVKKLPLVRKLSTLLLILSMFQVAASSYSESLKFNIILKDATIEEVFKEIENQSDYRFLYRHETIENTRITLNVHNASIEEVLREALQDADIDYTILANNLVVIKPVHTDSKLQGITVTGKIISGTDQLPLPGVNVLEKGTLNGTVTDLDGEYSITVSSTTSKIVFSYLGYVTREITVGDQSVVDVTLNEDVLELEQVVFIGYGSMKRSDLTGAISSVTEDKLRGSTTTNIDQALQGRIAGVQVTQNSGQPGGAASIRIRGTSSITGSNEPLYVIDGIPFVANGTQISGFDWAGGANGQNRVNPLSTINPNDITDIQVLKDASASAIYGSQAANGVIIISTKRGTEGKSTLSYNTYYGYQSLPRKMDMMNLREYADYRLEIAEQLNQEPDERYLDVSLLGEGTDWQNEVFRNAWRKSHQLSVTGGTERASYMISGSMYDEDGIIIGSGFKRFTTRINLDSKLNDWLTLGASMVYANTNETITLNDGSDGVVMNAMLMQPDVPVRNFDGEYAGPDNTDARASYNPVALALIRTNKLNREKITSSFFVSANIIKGLNFRSEIAYDNNNSINKAFHPTAEFGTIKKEMNYLRQREENSFFWIWKNYLTYNRVIAEKHNLSAMLGIEAQESKWQGIVATTEDFVSNDLQVLDLGIWGTNPPDAWKDGSTKMSEFGRFNYNYDERYLGTFTLRRDGSSKFGPENKWGWFPSGSFAWRLSQENFIKNIAAITNLKLRFSYGLVGNEPGGTYLYGSTLLSFNGPWGAAYRMEKIRNEELKWESTAQANLGFDLALFNSRVELVVDIYDKQTKDMLLQVSVPRYIGGSDYRDVQAPVINVGRMQNRGLEISLTTRNIQKSDFSWTTNFDFTLNRNKVLELSDSIPIWGNHYWYAGFDNATMTSEGEPIGVFYGYVTDGIFENQEQILEHAVQIVDVDSISEENPNGVNWVDEREGVWIGDIRFKDLNGDGVINADDRTIIGDPNPDFTFGFNNTFSFLNFDVSVYLQGSVGAEILNTSRYATEGLASPYANQLASVIDRAQFELIDPEGDPEDPANIVLANPGTDIPRYATNDFNSNKRMSDRYIEDGSYLRIQNLTLGYTLPNKWISKAKISRLRMYVNAQNVYTFTKYSGYDPEIGAYNQDPRVQNVDMGRYPSPRIVTFGLDINF